MVIQRIQSIYLLIAVILMVVFAFFPALSFELADKTVLYGALESGRAGSMHINPLLITLIILISVLALIDIFLFKNLQRQMTVCFIDIIIGLAMLIAICVQAFVVGNREGWTVTWQWYMLLPVLSIIFLMMAHKAMSNDKKKLRDADRLR
jgi:phosphoglycerol transferase MdoB-like AlkP superfamily enzyme